MKLIVSQEAAGDLYRLRAFLADKNPGAARRAAAAIANAVPSKYFPRADVHRGVRTLVN